MTSPVPEVPAGSGQHPITFLVLNASRLDESMTFYRAVFGWQLQSLGEEMAAGVTPGGPAVTLRTMPPGSPGTIPFIAVTDVRATLDTVAAAGGAIDREPWTMPMVGTLARFKDPSGTIYGLSEARPASPPPRIAVPTGANPRPAPNSVCSIELYAADAPTAGRFFGEQFGWGSLAIMPPYLSFDPGAGIGGVFQTHTPASPAVAYIYSPTVAATLAKVKAAGGVPMGEAMAVPGFATFGYFADPSGTMVGLMGE